MIFILTDGLPARGLIGRSLSGARDPGWRNPLEGATYTRLTDYTNAAADAVLSPDGNLVAFICDRTGFIDVWLLQLSSGQFINLTKKTGANLFSTQARALGFSADGKLDPQRNADRSRMAYVSQAQGREAIYVADR